MPFDVIFMSYYEPEAHINYENVLNIRPDAKHLSGIKGIGKAHKQAALLAKTDHFFIVDADNWVFDDFKFEFPPDTELPAVAVWRSINAVNGLRWFNGGIKLVSKQAINTMDMNGVDFFSTMQGSRAYFDHPASENRFNSTPYSAFRTAFRETAKISSGLLAISNARNLLNVWCTVGADKKNGDWCIKGARLGAEFGTNSSRNLNLKMINKSNFIKAEFIKAGGKYNE